ncbi:hypothetical protein KKF61_02635 [Patescibacteria group bacterium]|nr:hypothetical protein [Patescibacteria group bacterium]MBU0963816.1 hypothetical protein [Patescibacteria group bacterium]
MAKTLTMPTYRIVLKEAFDIVKKRKFLWVFGFFAALLGAGGEFETLFTSYSNLAQTSTDILSVQSLYQGGVIWSMFTNVKYFIGTYPWQTFIFILMFVVLGLVLLWLAIISQIALFDAAAKFKNNKKVGYAEGYRIGNKFFGPVFLINVVVKVILYFLFIAVSAPLITWFLVGNSVLGGVIFIILLFLLYIPLSIIAAFVVKYTVAYIVIKDKKWQEAIKLSWELFKKNWLTTIEMAFILLVFGILVGLAIILLVGISSIPFILISLVAIFINSSLLFNAATFIGIIVWFIIIAILGAAYVSYQYTAWTLLFLKLVDRKAESKLVRWFSKIVPDKA